MAAFLASFVLLGWAMFWLKRRTGGLFFRPAPAPATLTFREKLSDASLFEVEKCPCRSWSTIDVTLTAIHPRSIGAPFSW